MAALRRIGPLAYIVAATLLLFPMGDYLVAVWPLHPSVVRWRFGAIGILSNALVFPVLAAFLAITTAALLEHRRVQLVAIGLAAVVALALLAISGMFVLDAIQLRASVVDTVKSTFEVAAVQSLVKLLLALASVVAVGLYARSNVRRGHRKSVRADDASPVLRTPGDRLAPGHVIGVS